MRDIRGGGGFSSSVILVPGSCSPASEAVSESESADWRLKGPLNTLYCAKAKIGLRGGHVRMRARREARGEYAHSTY